jgi:GTP cyclohydrolase II
MTKGCSTAAHQQLEFAIDSGLQGKTKETRKVSDAELPTLWGNFRIQGYERRFQINGDMRVETAMALVYGGSMPETPLLRIHSQCLTGDVLGSLRCDCRAQLELSLRTIVREGSGMLIYEMQEGRGIGLMAKLSAYAYQDLGLDTVEANQKLGLVVDARDYQLPVEIIRYLGVRKVRLLSNNPEKCAALVHGGIEVVELIPCEVQPDPYSMRYLKTKKERLGHLLTRV